MTEAAPQTLFADVGTTAAEHFRLHLFGAVLLCIEHAAACAESFESVLERFPFLVGYNNELAQRLAGLSSSEAFQRWCLGLTAWEERVSGHLPLRALRTALGLDAAAVMCLVTVGLVEEDGRFGRLFDLLQGTSGQPRPTAGVLRRIWGAQLQGADFSQLLRRSRRLGLLQVINPDEPQQDVALQIPAPFLDALRGDECEPSPKSMRHIEAAALLPTEELVLAPETRRALTALSSLLASGEARAVILRGARHNGRRTALGAVARAMGRGILELSGEEKINDERWRRAATLGLLRHALPVAAFDLAPGETLTLPDDWPCGVPLGIVLGRQGGIAGDLASEAVTLALDLPDVSARLTHWQRCLGGDEATEVASRFRIGAGQIHRTARVAKMSATLAGRERITDADLLEAMRSLNRQALDALAQRLTADGDWSRLCAAERTMRELEHLESRCRHRECLPALLETATCAGVCALFAGPSGTGKTHAARLLAAALQKDLYQLDLSAVVNKYIGETEKNLNRVLEVTEELDVILLLDEGDALLTQRTDVQNANDRYANLETNFLLQRIESYQGILIVTTNARTRIDSSFERRMDVVVEFHAPDAEQRWSLWQLHLPPKSVVSADFLGEAASRCELTGGQIRNATMHAALLALDNGGVVTTAYLEAAIRREYGKVGGVCPLRNLGDLT
jgi:hypothetical protein